MKSEKFQSAMFFIKKNILPLVIAAVEDACDNYQHSRFNDSWIFGTQFWRNLWNRVSELAKSHEPIISIDNKNYCFSINGTTFRCHKNNPETGMPSCAKAAKSEARSHMLPGLAEFLRPLNTSFVIASDATPDLGLQRVFVGELIKDSTGENRYYWGEKIPLFNARDMRRRDSGETLSRPEDIVYPEIKLVLPHKKKKGNE